MKFPKNKAHVFLARRQNADRWITVHPNGKDAKGRPALIDGEGIVKGGMGGKFNGKNIKDARKGVEKKEAEKKKPRFDYSGAKTREEAIREMPDAKFIKKYGDAYLGFESKEIHDEWAKDSWTAKIGTYRNRKGAGNTTKQTSSDENEKQANDAIFQRLNTQKTVRKQGENYVIYRGDGKPTGMTIKPMKGKKRGFRIEDEGGKLYYTMPEISSVVNFMEKFWGDQRKRT